MDENGLENRIPLKLINAEGEWQCSWINTHGKRFTEPFFDDTHVNLRILYPENRSALYRGSLNEMRLEGESLERITPVVIIFHLSRCGSTLVSQLFATSGRFIVLSEVPFFDDLLTLPFRIPDFDKTEIPGLLSSSINIYGRKRDTLEEHVIMKTDCWHIFFYDTLRKMFPAVPFVLMYRSPGEVFRSLNKIAGIQTIPELVDPRIFGLPGMPEQYNREVYTAAILEKVLTKFSEVAETDNNCLLANYNEGALEVVKKIAAFANIALSDEEIRVMDERSRYHSKNPDELFTKEPVAELPECLMEATRLYEMLDAKRQEANSLSR